MKVAGPAVPASRVPWPGSRARKASSSSSRAVLLEGPVALVGSGPVIPAEREASQAAASCVLAKLTISSVIALVVITMAGLPERG